MRTRLFLALSLALLLFSGTRPGRYYSRFRMPYLEELRLRNNHTFVYNYSHFENRHDEHRKKGKWELKDDSLFLDFSDEGRARYLVAGDELRNGNGEQFKRK